VVWGQDEEPGAYYLRKRTQEPGASTLWARSSSGNARCSGVPCLPTKGLPLLALVPELS
jgi:hypothetical protein